MKHTITWTGLLLLLAGIVCTAEASGTERDTIEITLPNQNKVYLYVQNREDLEELKKFDLNEIIREIQEDTEGINDPETSQAYREYKARPRKIGNSSGSSSNRIKVGSLELNYSENSFDEIPFSSIREEIRNDEGEVVGYMEKSDFSSIKKEKKVDNKSFRSKNTFGFELGTNNWLQNGQFPHALNEMYSVRPWGSWYVGLNSTNITQVGGGRSPLFFEWGPGISWYNFKFDDTSVRIGRGAEGAEFFAEDPSVNAIKSKLTATYLNFSFVPMLDFGRGRRKITTYSAGSDLFLNKYGKRSFRIGFGGYAGYRIHSHSKFVYVDGRRQRERINNHHFMENFRYGLRARVGWKGLDLYANYDLNPIFASGRGPELNAFSLGLIF